MSPDRTVTRAAGQAYYLSAILSAQSHYLIRARIKS